MFTVDVKLQYNNNLFVGFVMLIYSRPLLSQLSVILNNRLSQRENLILVLTHKSNIRYQNSVGKRRSCSSGTIYPLFHNIFNIYFLLNESNYMFICEIWLFHWYFPQFCKSDLSQYGFLEVFQRFPLTSR